MMETILAYWGVFALVVVLAIVGVLCYLNNKRKAKELLEKLGEK